MIMALFAAAATGNIQQLQSLIEEDSEFEVNCVDTNGKTLLHIASEEGHLETVTYLLRHGAQVEKTDTTGQTPLHVASKKGHLQIIKALLKEGANVNKCDKDGFTSLHLSSFEGHQDIVQYLVKEGAERDAVSKDYWTPLHLAVGGSHLNIVKFLSEKGANINICSNSGFTALHAASLGGNIDCVKYLISQGAKLNECTDDGWTPLSLASHGGHLGVVEVLVNAGAEIDKALEDGMTPLHLAAREGHMGIVEVLLKNGAAIDKGNIVGFTALHTASSHGHLEIVRNLVRKRAQLDRYDSYNRTPLFYASQGGHFDVVQYLINKGADIGQYDKRGLTALHIASLKGHVDIVKYLVAKGADVLEPTDDELTPLHLALAYGHRDVINYLKTEGAKKPNKIFSGLSKAGKKMKDFKIYDEWASFAPTGYVKLSSRREGAAVYQNDLHAYIDFAQLSDIYATMDPHKTPKSPYLPSQTVVQQQSLRDPTKLIRKKTWIRLNNGGIEARIPPSEADKDITVEALTDIPTDLTLEKNEAIISVGLKLSPPGLRFQSPVEVTMLHSAILTKPEKAEIVLYTRRTSSDEFSRIVSSKNVLPRCIVRKRDLTLYIDHFSEWWIISYIRRYFIGKRLICTPYVPISAFWDVEDCVYLNINDDIKETKADDIPGYKVAFPGEQYSIRWGQGPLKITYLEGKEEVDTRTLEECAFYDMTSHRIPFTLQPREGKLARILLTFILEQRITKYIKFPMIYNAPLSSPGLAESPGSSDHRHETEDSSSAESAGTGDGSKVLMSPRSSSPLHVESLHRYQVTHTAEAAVVDSTSSAISDYQCLSVAIEAEGTTGGLASPAFAANILQELAPRLPGGQMNQPSGNVFINQHLNVRKMVINNPQGDSSTTGPVPMASVIPQRLKHELQCRLNRESPIRQDWKGLASELELDEYINSLEQYKNPTEELLVIAESSKKIQNLEDLAKAFHRMNRGDCEELCLNYAFEGKRTTSADAHKDPMKDEDTDSSDD